MDALTLTTLATIAAASDTTNGILASVLTFVLGGGFVHLFRARSDNRKTGAESALLVVERQQTLDKMQAEVLERVRKDYSAMASEVDTHKIALADERRRGAEKDLRIEILERRLEALHDEVTALRAQLGLDDRRDTRDGREHR